MQYRLHPNFVPSLWYTRDGRLWFLLGGCLLALVLSACTTGSQGNVSQDDPVLATHEQAWRSARTQAEEKLALRTLCNVYNDRGQPTNAIACYQRALASHMYQPAERGWLLNRLGYSYHMLSQYDQAIAHFEQALAIARKMRDRAGEGWPLLNLGRVSNVLGRYEQAIVYFEQAVAVMREVHDQRGEGISLNHLGVAHQNLHRYEQAIVFHQQALTIAREVGEGRGQSGEGTALNALGNAYYGLRQYDQAIAFHEQALAVRWATGDRFGEGRTLTALGRVSYALAQYDYARAVLEQALAVLRRVGDRRGEGLAFASLMAVWKAQHQPRLAIFYGKQAVNVLQEIRGHLQPLAEELQESFLLTQTPIYRELAGVLIAEGRLLEAQQVLDLLKVEEYFDFIRRDAPAAAALHRRATLTPEETRWAERYAAIADQVATLGAERGTLRARPTRTAAEEARLAQLEADLTAATWAFQRFLADLQTEVGRTPLAQEKLFQLRETQGLMADLRDLGPGTVALYTLVGAETSHVLLITPDVQLARNVPITAADLSRKVAAFRDVLEAVRHQRVPPDPRPLARELYELLVAPVAAELHAVQAQTLLWSLDGVLRYVPLAALYDGDRYLIERYALVVFTPASQARLKDTPQSQWRILGLGVSKAHPPFTALPGVVRELRGLIRDPAQGATEGVLPGTIQLDEAFTSPAMLAAFRQGYPVVHIASHFRLQPGDETASFLLLGDGSRLSLAQVKTWPTVLSGVDLLTLSACHTAAGGADMDGKEVEGFGVLAQRQGAKAVLATLWAVEDTTTQEVMQTFYRLRGTLPGLSKAEALRQAQLRLLGGTEQLVVASRAAKRGLETIPENPREPSTPMAPLVPPPPVPYAHPYYWAPFVLMGNWQ